MSRGRKERHACSVIGTPQYKKMESSCAGALLVQRAGEHLSCRESKGAGNHRFRPTRGTGGNQGAGNQHTLPKGDSQEHGDTGNQCAGEGDSHHQEGQRAPDQRGPGTAAGGDSGCRISGCRGVNFPIPGEDSC